MNRYLKLSTIMALGVVLLLPVFARSSDDKIPITTASDQARDYYLQGRDLFEKLRLPDARVYFEKAIAEDQGFALAYLGLSQSGPSTKHFFDNLEKAKNSMKNASRAEQQLIIGLEAGVTGNPAKQHQIYQKLVEVYPKDERTHNLLGNYYFGQQEYDKAIEQYNLARKINSKFSQLYNQLGYSYRFLKQYDQAETAFKEYIKLIPDDPNPFDSHAELLMKIGNFEESITQYRKALAIDPTFVASYSGIATCLNFMGDYDGARMAATELNANAVNDGQRRAGHFVTAVSYVDEGKIEEAIREIEKQMVFAQQISDAVNIAADLTIIGTLMLEIDRPDDAFLRFDDALKVVLDSDLSEEIKNNNRLAFLFNEAIVELARGNFEKAKSNQKEYARGARANTNRFQIWLSHELAGRIALQETDYKTAIAEFQRSNQQNTYNLFRQAIAYEKLGDRESARQFCQQIVDYNQLNNLNYGLIRHKAKQMLDDM